MNAPDQHLAGETDVLLQEITQQPGTFLESSTGLGAQTEVLEEMASKIRDSAQPVVLTGMGSSLDACQAAASMLGRLGVPVLSINTAELAHFRVASLRPGTCVIAVSQSGLSAEVVRLAESLSAVPEVWLAGITNGLDNPLAERARVTLDMRAGHEVGPATKTFTATMVALHALCAMLPGRRTAREVTDEAAVLGQRAMEVAQTQLAEPYGHGADIAQRVGDAPHLVLLGRGVGRAAAEVGALVLKEASRTACECMDAAEFRHGPLELAGPTLAAILVSLEPTTIELDRRLLHDLASRGGRVLAIGQADPGSAVDRLVLPPVAPLLDVALASLPLQLLAWHRARHSEGAPGEFLIGSKVTTLE